MKTFNGKNDFADYFTASCYRFHLGDEIRVEGRPDGGEPAALDYIEIAPEK